ncbi:hypothetical protein Mapa_014520 [Marchantia paleacea]|nr:hypothetical protein Mapa_014520 [Marchantia paleacea]
MVQDHVEVSAQWKGKLIIIANNCPPLRKSERLNTTPCSPRPVCSTTVEITSTSELPAESTTRVCCHNITDPGDSGIIRSMPTE